MSPSIKDVKVKRSKLNPDLWEVRGGGYETIRTMSHERAKEIAGARRRVILKTALRKAGVGKLPRSLYREVKKGL